MREMLSFCCPSVVGHFVTNDRIVVIIIFVKICAKRYRLFLLIWHFRYSVRVYVLLYLICRVNLLVVTVFVSSTVHRMSVVKC
jgi:hypothetical protein